MVQKHVPIEVQDGNSVSHKVASVEEKKSIKHGIVFRADHSIRPITLESAHSLEMDNFLPIQFQVSSGKFLPIQIRKGEKLAHFTFVREDNMIVDVTACKVNTAVFTGVAFVVRTREILHDIPKKTLNTFPEYHASEGERLRKVLPFGHRACQDKALTGGKGANLARLQAITHEVVKREMTCISIVFPVPRPSWNCCDNCCFR